MITNNIENSRDYDAIARRIEELVNAEPQTPAAWELKQHIYTIITYEQNKIKSSTKSYPKKYKG